MELLLSCLGEKRRILKLKYFVQWLSENNGIQRWHYSYTQAFCYKANIYTSNLEEHYLSEMLMLIELV